MRKSTLKGTEGHSTLTIIVLLLIFSALFLAVSSLFKQSLLETRKAVDEMKRQIEVNEIAQDIFRELKDDSTPETHSNRDAVWSLVEAKNSNEVSVELTDISSRLNPNWLRTKLLEETVLKNLIESGETPDELRALRNKNGFIYNLDDLIETYGEENLEKYFTLYSWANINVTYEESLEMIYRQRYGDKGADLFRKLIQQKLTNLELWEQHELPQLFGEAEESLYPVINTMPLMNVNTMDSYLLGAILSYPYQGSYIMNPASIKQSIINGRAQGEVTPEQLLQKINPQPEQMRVLEYLGTQTAFWQLNITLEGETQSFIYAFDGENWLTIK